MKINFEVKELGFIKDPVVINQILLASLKAVDPINIVKSAISLLNGKIEVRNNNYDLSQYRKVFVIGIGKASQSMALGTIQVLQQYIDSGIVITKRVNQEFSDLLGPSIKTIIGDHPIPAMNSLNSANELIKFASGITKDDLVICLISGGGSALITRPVPDISLSDLQELTILLLNCGATIDEINTVRKHLDSIKGGGLAKLLFPAQVLTLVLSDVIGDHLSMIASGPTTLDSTTYEDAFRIIEKYSLKDKVSKTIISYIKRGIDGKIPETVKIGDPALERVFNKIIGNNQLASKAGKLMAEVEGFNSKVISNNLQGKAFDVGKELGSLMKDISKKKHNITKPICLIAGGETTVDVKGSGLGGRNLEVALACAMEIEGLKNVCMLALATDGEDGPTDAAGAIITGDSIRRARSIGLNPEESLANNDTYHFFNKLGCLLKTGSTGTNVNDLYFLFVY
jgi:glycerate 2-kinase